MTNRTGNRTKMWTGAILAVGVLAMVIWLMLRPSSEFDESTTGPVVPATTRAASSTTSDLEIAVEDSAAPWSQSDGTGCANDIVLAAYRAAFVPVKLKVFPYARAKEMAITGQIPACFAMSWSPELQGKIIFADADKPLYICRSTYVQNLQMPVKANSEKTLPPGTRLGTVINYEYPPSVTSLSGQGVIFEATHSEEINLKKLSMGRIDLAIINIDDLRTARLLFAKAGVTGQVGIAFAGDSMPSHIGFSIAHPRGEFARAKFNEGYAAIKKDGTLARIYAQWRAK